MSNCSVETGNFTQDRMAQIKNRDTQASRYLATAMDRYSYTLFFLILILILRNAEILPESIASVLIIIIVAWLIIDMLYTFYSYRSRNPLNFDTIIWSFNKSSAPTANSLYGAGGAGGSSSIRCVDSACCAETGMRWDSGVGKCTII